MTISVYDLIHIKAALISGANNKDSLSLTMAEKYSETAERIKEEANRLRELADQFWELADTMIETRTDKRISVKY